MGVHIKTQPYISVTAGFASDQTLEKRVLEEGRAGDAHLALMLNGGVVFLLCS